jgi:hypothetical protein
LALFGRLGRREPRDGGAAAQVKAWVIALLELPEAASVTVSEILCPDPACPDLETVILVMRPGRKTEAFKVRRPLAAVTEQDLQEVLVSAQQMGRA